MAVISSSNSAILAIVDFIIDSLFFAQKDLTLDHKTVKVTVIRGTMTLKQACKLNVDTPLGWVIWNDSAEKGIQLQNVPKYTHTQSELKTFKKMNNMFRRNITFGLYSVSPYIGYSTIRFWLPFCFFFCCCCLTYLISKIYKSSPGKESLTSFSCSVSSVILWWCCCFCVPAEPSWHKMTEKLRSRCSPEDHRGFIYRFYVLQKMICACLILCFSCKNLIDDSYGNKLRYFQQM